MKTTAIVLAAGQGKRMGSDVAKQYLLLRGKPVLYYTLKNFEESPVDEMILVTGEDQIDYCKKEIVERFGFGKVRKIVAGGKERYHSVALGLRAIADSSGTDLCDYVLIHDGARPFVNSDMIERGIEAVCRYQACVLGMPVKDTIKISDENGFAADTPNRNLVWQIQTPQIFSFPLIRKAYEQLLEKEDELRRQGIVITDDAMVVELFSGQKVKLVEGSYENIKLTTPEDMEIAESFLAKM
jgi:2-C-methyl-D-erythritol 4-phosphate cytidylyltransferase